MGLINARSIVNKLNDFQSLIYSQSFDLFGVTKSWLTNKIFDNEILPTGYALIRKDRGSQGGGVILAINKSLSYQVLITPPSLELLCVEVNHSNSLIYCLVYIPPNASNEYLQEFFSYISKFSNQSNNLIIFGDFNFPDINWDASRPALAHLGP